MPVIHLPAPSPLEADVSLADHTDVLDWPFARTEDGDPPPILAELRNAPPCVVRLPAGAAESRLAWLVTRYADVRQALGDPRLSADERLPGAPVRIQVPPGGNPSSFLRLDDPEHARLRRMIQTEFTARRVKRLREPVQRLVDELLDELEALPRPADLHAVFSRALPTLVIARLLGVPEDDSAFFIEKTRVTISQEDPAVSLAAFEEMSEYLAKLALRKLESPGDDLISRLAVNHHAKGDITLDELVGIARLVLVAGHETTTNQIALNILALLRDDDLRARVTADDGALIPNFIEESMRYWSISQDAMVRLAVEDLELGGVAVSKGDAVVISVPAGNHDESVFACPHRIDPHRDTSGHLQWGFGPHYCQGAPLARLEMELSLRSLLRRFPNLRLAADPRTVFRRGTVFHGVTHLPVTW
ncbi:MULTISPECIES: cytochrome P450 [unclassified Streptomyces]|uniref:cytochrome P450 n=1 Tax=unclassified Streptomyces TaxID=2593676 RepID=UPI0024C4056B|nr:cytochrome P450 [Streptomyces sp. 378]MDK1344487.1 cytochrome P450 [Streptomyces sp. 378]